MAVFGLTTILGSAMLDWENSILITVDCSSLVAITKNYYFHMFNCTMSKPLVLFNTNSIDVWGGVCNRLTVSMLTNLDVVSYYGHVLEVQGSVDLIHNIQGAGLIVVQCKHLLEQQTLY